MYLMPNTGESDKPLHFRGTFLPVSLARKVLFCTFKFFCIFETLPDRRTLYICVCVSELCKKVLLSSSTEVCGTKKKLNFVDHCNQCMADKISKRRHLSLHLILPGQDYTAEGSTKYILKPGGLKKQRYIHKAFQHETTFTTMSALL
jgi:hypothetical protein